jgi:hypothetical protein
VSFFRVSGTCAGSCVPANPLAAILLNLPGIPLAMRWIGRKRNRHRRQIRCTVHRERLPKETPLQDALTETRVLAQNLEEVSGGDQVKSASPVEIAQEGVEG